MAVITVRSVLGETRDAEINHGGGFPWFNCPFCSSGVYVTIASPDALAVCSTVGEHARCSNPWCVANPDMPVHEARRIDARISRETAENVERERNHAAAMRRITEFNDALRAANDRMTLEAAQRGACVPCALSGRGFIHHRKGCPR